MRSKAKYRDIEIDGVEYRFIPGRCEIYPKVSTDVIVQQWVDECIDLTPNRAGFLKPEKYYPSYLAWGGSLGLRELNQALKRLGTMVGQTIREEGKQSRGWVGANLKSDLVD